MTRTSPIEPILSGEAPAAVYRVATSAGSLFDARAATAEARDAGWTALLIDGSDVVTKAGFLSRFGRAFGAGDDFGLNLDAMYDVLRDVDAPELLVWSDADVLAAADGDAFAAILDVLATRAEDGGFTVVLSGEHDSDALAALPELA